MSIETAGLILALLWGPTLLWLIFRVIRGPGSRRSDSFADASASGQRSNLAPAALLLEYWVCMDCRSVNHQGAKRCYSCGVNRAIEPVPPPAPDPLPTGNGWVPVMEAASDVRPTETAAATVRQMSNGHAPEPVTAAAAFEPVPAVAIAATAARATRRPRIGKRSDATAEAATLADASVAAHTAAVAPEQLVAVPELEPEIVPAAAVVANTARATKRPRIGRRNGASAEPAAIADTSVAAHQVAVDPQAVAAVPELEPEIVPAAVAASKAPATRRPRTTRRKAAATEAAALADVAADAPSATVEPDPVIVAALTPLPVAPVAAAPMTGAPAADVTPRVAASAPPVCPFLGFKGDQTTHCDYADARNMCHAAAASAGSSRPSLRRLGRGGGRSVSISPEHQLSLCLTTNHQQCERYPKARAAEG